MRVIVLANQKGGVGKTTLAGHLGVMAEQRQAGPVTLIDTDPQGSLAAWWNERDNESPVFSQVDIPKIDDCLVALAKAGIKLAIIDTPPSVTEILRQVLRIADLVLIPTRPSPHDLRAVSATIERVEQAGKKMIFVINGAAPRARITGEAAVVLSQYGTVAPVTLYQRTDFASSMIDGRTVQEINPRGRSAEEVTSLWTYVSTQLSKLPAK